MNPQKSLLAVALAMTLGGAEAVEAAPIVNYSFLGTFAMLTPSGTVQGGSAPNDPHVTGSMTMDLGTGTGSGSFQPSVTFTSGFWTTHSIVLTATAPGTVHADMMIDWIDNGPGNNIGVDGPFPVTAEFGMAPTSPCSGMGCYTVGNTFTLTTLDGPNADGIPGNPMTTGPFQGYNAAFNGTLTVTSVVPVPAAVWLLGSGLLGLAGAVFRRKISTA
jgi:hypothetical protein